MTDSCDVAIIGAGLTGSALAIHLARRIPSGTRALLLGAPGATARGVAYATAVPEHLLNVRAARMSLFPDDPDHFVRWLAESGAVAGVPAGNLSQHYAPRMVYGRYVEATLREAIAAGRGDVDIVEDKAASVRKEGVGFVIGTAGGKTFNATVVVLCLGHGPPSFPLPPEAITPAAGERMIADPWSDPRMALIEPESRLLFVGSSQTMADQAVGLAAAAHRGAMVAISRHGHLPASQLPLQSEPVSLSLQRPSLLRLFQTVVQAAREEERAGRDWRAVIDGLRPLSQELWERLTQTERRRFLRHADAAWLIYRSRLAPAVGARVAALRNEGRLDIRAARLVSVVRTESGVTVGLRRRGGSRIELESFDWIVNCSGVGRMRPDAIEPLIAQLLGEGLIRQHPLGRGLDIGADHTLIDARGLPVAGLFALGPLAGGRFFESIAVPEISEQCARLAEELAMRLPADTGFGPQEAAPAR